MDLLPDSAPVTLTLNDEERRLMDDISFAPAEKSVPVRKPPQSRPFRRGPTAPAHAPPPEMDGLEMFTNPTKQSAPSAPQPEMWDGGDEEPEPMMGGDEQPHMGGGGGNSGPSEGYKTIEDEKADLLNKIARLAKKGMHTSSRLTSYSDIEEIRTDLSTKILKGFVSEILEYILFLDICCVERKSICFACWILSQESLGCFFLTSSERLVLPRVSRNFALFFATMRTSAMSIPAYWQKSFRVDLFSIVINFLPSVVVSCITSNFQLETSLTT